MSEKSVNEPKDSSTEIIQSEEHKQRRLEKIKTDRITGTVSKDRSCSLSHPHLPGKPAMRRNPQRKVPSAPATSTQGLLHHAAPLRSRGPQGTNATGAPTRCEAGVRVCGEGVGTADSMTNSSRSQALSQAASCPSPSSTQVRTERGRVPCLPLQCWRRTQGWSLVPVGPKQRPIRGRSCTRLS